LDTLDEETERMTTLDWKNTVVWSALSLLFLLLALVIGPAPVLY
jgi:hypothetical protein